MFVRFLFRERYGDILYLLAIYAAAGTILGHNFPFYLGFRGGKGVACTAGLIIFFHPYMVIPEIITFFWYLFYNTLCIAWIDSGAVCVDCRNDSIRADGSFRNGADSTE